MIQSRLRSIPPAVRYLLTFGGLTGAGIAALLIEPVDNHLVIPFTNGLATFCAFVIRLFGGHATANDGTLMLASGMGGVRVESGCNGVEVSILLAAAILAFPAPLRSRLTGAAIGILLLQAINLVRIISLLYLSAYSKSWFDFFHLYLWDAVIMLDGLVIFLSWHRWHGAQAA